MRSNYQCDRSRFLDSPCGFFPNSNLAGLGGQNTLTLILIENYHQVLKDIEAADKKSKI